MNLCNLWINHVPGSHAIDTFIMLVLTMRASFNGFYPRALVNLIPSKHQVFDYARPRELPVQSFPQLC